MSAELVAAWEPDAESERQMFGRLELARALEKAVKADPTGWSVAPQDVVTALGERLYIESYFRALAERGANIVPQAPAVLAAALAQPSTSGSREEDQDTEEVPTDPGDMHGVVLDLVRALANEDADIASTLNDLWERALAAVRSVPEADDGLLFAEDDPLNSAINRSWGHGLQTVLALAAREFRNQGTVRPEFVHTLDAVIGMDGSVGLEFRAILAAHRPLVEVIASTWLEAHATALFREAALAQETFDLTVKWARPTTWLYRELKAELFDAALRGADNAVRLVVVASLGEVDGYEFDTLIKRLGKDPAALAAAAEDAAFLVQKSEPDSPDLAVATRFWTLLLDTDQTKAPAQALGRWALVDNIDDDQWAHLTARTLDRADGRIDDPVSVADRAASIPPSSTSRDILLRLLNTSEPWERHHAAAKAIDLLRASVAQPADDSFRRLRTRLMDLGYHEASAINPLDASD